MECEDDDADSCIRCQGKVFEAERITAKSGPFHKYCMSCLKCNGVLDASTFLNGPDDEIYCRHCYAGSFGHKAKSEYKGWMDSKTIMGEKGDADACPRCDGKVFEAEKCSTKVSQEQGVGITWCAGGSLPQQLLLLHRVHPQAGLSHLLRGAGRRDLLQGLLCW